MNGGDEDFSSVAPTWTSVLFLSWPMSTNPKRLLLTKIVMCEQNN